MWKKQQLAICKAFLARNHLNRCGKCGKTSSWIKWLRVKQVLQNLPCSCLKMAHANCLPSGTFSLASLAACFSCFPWWFAQPLTSCQIYFTMLSSFVRVVGGLEIPKVLMISDPRASHIRCWTGENHPKTLDSGDLNHPWWCSYPIHKSCEPGTTKAS